MHHGFCVPSRVVFLPSDRFETCFFFFISFLIYFLVFTIFFSFHSWTIVELTTCSLFSVDMHIEWSFTGRDLIFALYFWFGKKKTARRYLQLSNNNACLEIVSFGFCFFFSVEKRKNSFKILHHHHHHLS